MYGVRVDGRDEELPIGNDALAETGPTSVLHSSLTFVGTAELVAPLQRDEVTGLERLAEHGRAVFADAEPDAVLSRAPRVRYEREGSEYRVVVPLPGADPDRLDVVKIDDELTITAGLRRRSLKVPRRIAPLSLASARLEGSSLVVSFSRAAADAEAV